MSNPFKKRVERPALQDPVQTLQIHGVHGERKQTEHVPIPSSPRRLVSLPISSIRANRYQKRETVNEEEYQILKEQIRDLGLLFTAVVCEDPDDPAYYNLMMGGHLRLQAAAELGITEVQASVQNYDSLKIGKGTYFENRGRQPLSLVEQGLVFLQFQEDEGWTQEEIAQNLHTQRPHVSAAILAVRSAPDIQEMLRKAPDRGKRCAYYLRQLDELGPEKAIALRGPIIADFLSRKISTDEVKELVADILKREKSEGKEGEVSVEVAQGKEKVITISKNLQRYVKRLGDRVPSHDERAELVKVKESIEAILSRE